MNFSSNQKASKGKTKNPLVFDCFPFFNELDLLEIRLNELNDVVDYFVLVESTKTHTGKEKPLYFEENKERFRLFSDKIIHVVVDDMPTKVSSAWKLLEKIYYISIQDKGSQKIAGKREAWNREAWQRNAIIRGLLKSNPSEDDIVIVSDVDEIPSKEWVRQVKNELNSTKSTTKLSETATVRALSYIPNGLWWKLPYSIRKTIDSLVPINQVIVCRQNHYTYFLNGFVSEDWLGTTACSFKTLKLFFGSKPNRVRATVTIMRRGKVLQGGWHFNSLGGVDALIKKINAMAPHGWHDRVATNREELLRMMKTGESCFDTNVKLTYVQIDQSFPDWIVENSKKLERLIYSADEMPELSELKPTGK